MPDPAAYRAIADELREQIRTGALAPGERLPGIRALADRHGVTPPTAADALKALAAEGWVVVGHGRVTRVSDPLPPRRSSLEDDVEDLKARVTALEEQMRSRDQG